MAVLIEGQTLVVRKTALAASYPGGPEAFGGALLQLAEPPRFISIADPDLVIAGFYSADHLNPARAILIEHSLVEVDDDKNFVDYAFVDQWYGPTMPCPWLEWKRDPRGFTIAWLFGTDPSYLAVYDGWTPENLRAMERYDIRDEPGRVVRLGKEGEIEYAVDLQTGRVMSSLPQRELNPKDGPVPPRATNARRNDASAGSAEEDFEESIDELVERCVHNHSVVEKAIAAKGWRYTTRHLRDLVVDVPVTSETVLVEVDLDWDDVRFTTSHTRRISSEAVAGTAVAAARVNAEIRYGAIVVDPDIRHRYLRVEGRRESAAIRSSVKLGA